MKQSLVTHNSLGLNYSDNIYLFTKASERNVVNIIDKASKESLFNNFNTNLHEYLGPNLVSQNTESFLFSTDSKKYIEVLEDNLRRYIEPTQSSSLEIKQHLVTPVTIQTNRTSNEVDNWAAPIQTFEGRVINVVKDQYMDVILMDKTGGMPDHEASIELQWVSDQDKDLVKRGAIFYLSLYKQRSQSGSIRNSEEIRFRRLPSWSQNSIDKIKIRAEELLASHFKTAPLDNN